ncbi:uncharacterized protein MYCFIDRAFT_177067 [Pseudocercospora fijiensis CIRAD86]|uniref:Uncharacterized protein n=1 Tax=Pseudocercospora fijiensis (strain CIRAD86) TaxID=383855 RepID=M2YQT2_PSEFD|nr:uncharacterized protein MYCFIDRAFT_177067 [Pseudocercospora fijiensis CIRAD86]EME80085.1 hypothetical protein MYCFIDRAFT_177067 [Pseudocercospora fijiensis CIRAD86]
MCTNRIFDAPQKRFDVDAPEGIWPEVGWSVGRTPCFAQEGVQSVGLRVYVRWLIDACARSKPQDPVFQTCISRSVTDTTKHSASVQFPSSRPSSSIASAAKSEIVHLLSTTLAYPFRGSLAKLYSLFSPRGIFIFGTTGRDVVVSQIGTLGIPFLITYLMLREIALPSFDSFPIRGRSRHYIVRTETAHHSSFSRRILRDRKLRWGIFDSADDRPGRRQSIRANQHIP